MLWSEVGVTRKKCLGENGGTRVFVLILDSTLMLLLFVSPCAPAQVRAGLGGLS